MNILKYKNFFAFVIIFLSFFYSPIFAFEQPNLFFEGPNKITIGDEFNLKVLISSEEVLNAFDIEVAFPKDKVEFIGFNNAGSIIELWQNNPTRSGISKIKFSGGLFQSFQGNDGLLVTLKFKAITIGSVNFSFSKSETYIADGKGTLNKAQTEGFSALIINQGEKSVIPEQGKIEEYSFDTSVPELIVEIVKNPVDKINLISFNAIDKKSGVKQIFMRSKNWFQYSDWKEVVNPVIYPKSAWVVEIKAINNQNLENVVKIHRYFNLIYKILIPTLFLVTFGVFLVYNKGKRK